MRPYFILILIFHVLSSCKNDKKQPQTVPNTTDTEGGIEKVESAFKKRFPNINEVYWDILDSGYCATFTDGVADYKVNYDAQGNFQNRITLIELEALPASVQAYLNKKYKDANIAILQLIDNDKIQIYQIELESDTDYITLGFDKSGKLINEIKEPFSAHELQEQEEEGVEKDDN